MHSRRALRSSKKPQEIVGAGTWNILSTDMVHRLLCELEYLRRRPGGEPPLKRGHRTARVSYTRLHVHWSLCQWGRVLFTDKSRFNFNSLDRWKRACWRPNEQYTVCNIQREVSYGGGSIMICEGISLTNHKNLYILPKHL